jgi:hypothetical protein
MKPEPLNEAMKWQVGIRNARARAGLAGNVAMERLRSAAMRRTAAAQNRGWVGLDVTAGYGNANAGTAEIKEDGGKMVGLGRLELPTSPLSGVRSSHLSYRPNLLAGNILRDLGRSSNNGGVSVVRLARVI